MNLSNLKTGDLIVRAKGIFSTHYMVYIENRGGTIIVAENQNGFGVRYVTLAEVLVTFGLDISEAQTARNGLFLF